MKRRKAIHSILVPTSLWAILSACSHLRMGINLLSDKADSKNPIDPQKDDLAASIEYVEKRERMAPNTENQFCDFCKYYVEDSEKPGWGRCRLLSSGLVSAKGWCKVWKPIS